MIFTESELVELKSEYFLQKKNTCLDDRCFSGFYCLIDFIKIAKTIPFTSCSIYQQNL